MPENRLKIVIAVALSLVTAVIYLRTAWYPFSSCDDQEYVAQNIHVLSGLSVDSMWWAFSSFYAANWHPLTWLSLMLDAQIFGSNPAGYHLVNVALHIANTALLFYLFTYMSSAVWRSALVAALFALHPQHVESVTWITERKDVLSTLFWLTTLFLYAAYVKKASKRMYLLSIAVFACGLMAKPMLVTIPVVLLLLDYWPLGRLQIPVCCSAWGHIKALWDRMIIMEKLPFLALSACMSVVTICAQRENLANITSIPLSIRMANSLGSAVLYAAKMIFPLNLAAYYPLVPVPFWTACCAAILLGGAIYLAVNSGHKSPYLPVGLLWYLVTLLPVIGLIQVGGQAMADRYTYVPTIGLFVMAVWGFGDLAQRFPLWRKVICAMVFVILSGYTGFTCIQLNYWKDDVTLYAHSLAITKDNSFAHEVLGVAYQNSGQAELAAKEFTAALSLNPNDYETRRNLGILLYKQLGRPAEAVKQFEVSNRLRPDNPLTHYHMAKAFIGMGKVNEAVIEYRRAVEILPGNPYFQDDLGMALLQLNNIDEGLQHISEAVRLLPSYVQAAANLQYALSLKGSK